jgi:hypothetical protein
MSMNEEISEVGVLFVKSSGMYNIRWSYNDHVISIMVASAWAIGVNEKKDLDIKVMFEGVDVTDKYIEKLPNRTTIRPTLDNLQTILKIIDENVDDYIAQLEGDTDGEDVDASS